MILNQVIAMNSHGYQSVQMGHNLWEMPLKKGGRIVRLILRNVQKGTAKLDKCSLAETLKKILSAQTVLILQSVWVEMLKQFISFSMFMMKKF